MNERFRDISSYFTGKRIVVTGASGYLASNLVTAMRQINCSIIRISRKDNLPSIKGQASVTNICGDISLAEVWEKVVPEADIIYHFAAQTSVYEAEKDPIADFNVNALPVLHMVNACRSFRHCPVIVFAGTATQIGLSEQLPVTEDHPDKPITVYDMHKLAAESYLKHWARLNVVNATTLRLSNVYGPGPRSSSPDRGVINIMIRKALSGEELTIYGSGECLRDYVYVDDVIMAFLKAAVNIEQLNGKHFVIGSGRGFTIAQAIGLIAEEAELMTQRHICVNHITPLKEQLAIDGRNFVANTKAFSDITDWQIEYDLPTGIRRTLEFFAETHDSGMTVEG